MTVNSPDKNKSIFLKSKFIPAIIVTLLLGFNHKAISKELAASSYSKYLIAQIAEMNRRNLASVWFGKDRSNKET